MIYLLAVCGIRKRAHTRRALFSLQAGFNVAVGDAANLLI